MLYFCLLKNINPQQHFSSSPLRSLYAVLRRASIHHSLLLLDPSAFTSSHPSPFATIFYFVAHYKIWYFLSFLFQIQPDLVHSQILQGKIIFLSEGKVLGKGIDLSIVEFSWVGWREENVCGHACVSFSLWHRGVLP